MVDTHAHFYTEAYDADLDETLQRALDAGVTRILCPAINSATHSSMLALCRNHPTLCLPMMGVHPTDVDDSWEHEIEVIERYLAAPDPLDPPFCAIGEVGLDLHYGADHLPQQIAAFERQIELSVRYNLPLSIHTRDAWPEMFVVLEKYADRRLRGVMHAFSGTVDEYRRVRELGDFAFGVTGVVTYKKNHWRALLPEMNPAHIILETDAPWLPPEPFRGKRNESSYLGYIRDGVAAILGMTPGEVDRITTENADRIFGLDLP